MEVYSSALTDLQGNAINGSSITVYVSSTGTIANIFLADGTTPKPNPFLSGDTRAEGDVEFAAVDGLYDIKIDTDGVVEWRRGQGLFDPVTAQEGFYTDSGSANAYILSAGGGFREPTEYFDGMPITFLPANTSTGASTVSVAGLGAKEIRTSGGNQIAALAIKEGEYCQARYNESQGRFIATRLYHPKVRAAGLSAGRRAVPSGVTTTLLFDVVIQGDTELYESSTGTFSASQECVFSMSFGNIMPDPTGGGARRTISVTSLAGAGASSYSTSPPIGGQFMRQSVSITARSVSAMQLVCMVYQDSGSSIDVTGGSSECWGYLTIHEWT